MVLSVRIETESDEFALKRHQEKTLEVVEEREAISRRIARERLFAGLLNDLHANTFKYVDVMDEGGLRNRELVVGSRRFPLPPVRTD